MVRLYMRLNLMLLSFLRHSLLFNSFLTDFCLRGLAQ